MIELVAAFLRIADLDPTWEDVADTLWLAQEIGRHEPLADLEGITPKPVPDYLSQPQTGPKRHDGPETLKTGGEQVGTNTPSATAALCLPPAPGTPTPPSSLPFRTPAATALPGALALGRALRPLKRRLPSATTQVLDEEATAERVAEERIWTPVRRPGLTRWLDLALVIDQSPSMAIWARTVEELRYLLERHGAFRDVRIWLLNTDAADGRAVLYAGTESATSHPRPSTPRELVDPGGRRLILMVSDCVAPAWSSGAVPALLSLWGRTSPVAIVHVLPHRLWRYTAIETEPAELRAPHPGAPNARLDITSRWANAERESANAERELEVALAAESANAADLRDEATAPYGANASAVPVPVIALEPRWLAPWANLVAGVGGRPAPGIVTWAKPWVGEPLDTPEATGLEPLPTSLSPAERVRRFRAIVSPTAFELAGYLAGVPLTLPIMRLVQQAMLPGSAQVHLAEVLLGGLLERHTPADPNVHPDKVVYDFIDGARELLQDTVLGTDTLRVAHTVGDFVGRHAGRTHTFPSLLYAPDEEEARSTEERAFAAVTAKTLRRFGASYEELADRLEQKATASVPIDIPQRPPAGERETVPTSRAGEMRPEREMRPLERACVPVANAAGFYASGYFVAPDLIATASPLDRGTQQLMYRVRWGGRWLTATVASLERAVMVLRLQMQVNAEVLTPDSPTARARDGDTWITFGFTRAHEGLHLTGTVRGSQFVLDRATALPGIAGAPVIVSGELVGQVSGIVKDATDAMTMVEVAPTDEIRRAVDAANEQHIDWELGREAVLHELYERALAELRADRPSGISLLGSLLIEDPGYRDAAARRDAARQEYRLTTGNQSVKLNRLRLVVFDLNDGLVGTESLVYKATRDLIFEYSDLHHRLSLDSYAPYVGIDGVKLLSEMARQYQIRGKTPVELAAEREERFQTFLQDADPDGLLKPRFLSTLELLASRGVKMGICSSAPELRVQATLDRFGIANYFSAYATPSQGMEAKPSPEMYFSLLREFNVQSRDCLVVESSLLGLSASVAAGCFTLLLYSDYTAPVTFPRPGVERIWNSQHLADWFDTRVSAKSRLGGDLQ